MSVFSDALARLKSFYNGNAYDAATNSGGMGKGGHRENLIPALRDVCTVGEETAAQAEAVMLAVADVRAASLSGGGLVVAAAEDVVAGSLDTKIETAGDLKKTIIDVDGVKTLRLAVNAPGAALYMAESYGALGY